MLVDNQELVTIMQQCTRVLFDRIEYLRDNDHFPLAYIHKVLKDTLTQRTHEPGLRVVEPLVEKYYMPDCPLSTDCDCETPRPAKYTLEYGDVYEMEVDMFTRLRYGQYFYKNAKGETPKEYFCDYHVKKYGEYLGIKNYEILSTLKRIISKALKSRLDLNAFILNPKYANFIKGNKKAAEVSYRIHRIVRCKIVLRQMCIERFETWHVLACINGVW